jgi:hypothetical protein
MSMFLALAMLGFPWDPPNQRAERWLQITPAFVSYFPGYWKGVADSQKPQAFQMKLRLMAR